MATRPSRIILESGIASWDGDVDALFALIFDAPFPIHVEDDTADATTNFPPASYEDCLLLIGTAGSRRLYYSDGASWLLYDKIAAFVAASAATDATQMATDFNSLLSSLKTAGIMASS